MIQPQELRIGNLVGVVKPRYGERYLNIESITSEAVNIDFRSYNINELTPIPLTEEWLVKAGFVKEFTGYQEDNVMRAHIEKNLFIEYDLNHMALSIHQDTDIIGVDHIQYLHQLQNLYFALTGEELNVEI